jgi:hypothetical protein
MPKIIRDLDLAEINIARLGNTLFVPLPHALRRDVPGGCQCSYCKSHPHHVAQWDTLAIDACDTSQTSPVHYPEISA